MGRRIFISFRYDDVMQARGFNLLRWNPNVPLEFVGRHLLSPVDSVNKDYIKGKIREQLEGTSVTVVLVGRKTAKSYWVDFEIQESLKRGNGVLGIRLKGVPDGEIPTALKEAEAKTIDWSPDSFADEIEKAALIAGRPELGPPPERNVSAGAAAAKSCIR